MKERIDKMKNTKLKQMEELDAKIEKINYDLSGLESRKKEMEDSKFDKQQNIEKLEEEKRTILAKTDKMNRLEKIIYIAFASKNDLKQVDLLNAKITELRNEKDSIQDKIDIQNKLYADTIKEKDNYIEQRKQLYIENTNVNIQENTIKTTHVQDLAKIHKIAKQYEGSEIMKKLSQTIEKYVDRLLENTGENEKDVVEKEDEAEA
jgi:predicted  nucleic acid-binding Zn-ribbon protein